MNRLTRTMTATGLAGSVLFAAACGGGSTDKAGGAGDVEPTVLTFALPYGGDPPPQLESWAEALADQSNGNVTIDFQPALARRRDGLRDGHHRRRPGREGRHGVGRCSRLRPRRCRHVPGPPRAAARGQPRPATGGVRGRRPRADARRRRGPRPRRHRCVARPDAQSARRRQAVPAARRLRRCRRRHERFRPHRADAASRRRNPSRMVASAPLDDVDGYEQQLSSIVRNHYAAEARYVTANVNLWPRPLVIIMGEQAFDSLTSGQQSALREASAAAVGDALADSRAEDANAVPSLCRDGMTLAVASHDDLAELRRAFEPVYEQLLAEPSTKAYLEAIEALKDELHADPDTATCPSAEPPTGEEQSVSQLNGTYQWTLTDDDALEHGTPGDKTPQVLKRFYPTTFTAELDDGRWSLSQTVDSEVDGGTYEEFRDRIVFNWDGGLTLTFTYTTDEDGNLTLIPVQPMPDGDAFVWSTETWTKTTD